MTRDEGVLKALANSTRREIIRQIADRGTATYSEIMQVLGLDSSLESGRFNYHLKELTDAGLIDRIDGVYTITDLGTGALFLLDQVRDDRHVDRHGVLSAVISMSPKEEIKLFINQNLFGLGLVTSMVSLLLSFIFPWLFPIFLVLMTVGLLTLRESAIYLLGIAKKHNLGLSTLLLIDSNWFLIRSPNRGSFMAFAFFSLTSVVSLILFIILVASGGIMALPGVGLLLFAVVLFTTPIAFSIAETAIKKADALELMESE
ncbi:MAG: helix-turn-helix transcriptional regulator [Candidatus Thorarchaeota archaeon]|nr:MAG: helix-turn-helix transcriptional regulator [Candidatus Thorarchaeota archaeon]